MFSLLGMEGSKKGSTSIDVRDTYSTELLDVLNAMPTWWKGPLPRPAQFLYWSHYQARPCTKDSRASESRLPVCGS
jgi:hypothetical protein